MKVLILALLSSTAFLRAYKKLMLAVLLQTHIWVHIKVHFFLFFSSFFFKNLQPYILGYISTFISHCSLGDWSYMKAGEEERDLISYIITRMFVEQPLDLLIILNSPCCRPILFSGWVQSCIILGTQTNKRTNKQTKKQICYLCYSGWVQKWLCCSCCPE